MSHDLTSVAPERRDEVRRRIDVIERYLTAPGRRAAEDSAAALGLRHAQFYNLVRAWRLSGRPEMVDPGRRRPRGTTMSPTQRGVVDAVIAADCRAPVTTLIDRVVNAAEDGGITMPHREVIARMVRRVRPGLLPTDLKEQLNLIIDHTVLDIPVDYGGEGPRRPLATTVIDTASDTIVGIALSPGTPGPAATAAALADAARRGMRGAGGRSADRPKIGIVAMDSDEMAGLASLMEAAGLTAHVRLTGAHGAGRAIEALVGTSRDGIRLKPRLVWAYPKRRWLQPPSGAASLVPDEAASMVRERLLDTLPTAAFSQLTEADRIRLIAGLTRLSQSSDPV